MRLTDIEIVAQVGTITVTELRLWVREGWLTPSERAPEAVFDEVDLARVRLICELRDELQLGDDAVPVVLSLMDQLYGLRRELKSLAHAIADEPDEVRARIREAYRARLGGRRQGGTR